MDPAKGATSAREIDEILTQEILSSNITGRWICLKYIVLPQESLIVDQLTTRQNICIYHFYRISTR